MKNECRGLSDEILTNKRPSHIWTSASGMDNQDNILPNCGPTLPTNSVYFTVIFPLHSDSLFLINNMGGNSREGRFLARHMKSLS